MPHPASGLTGPPRTGDYRPSVAATPEWYGGNWGGFSLGIVEDMRRDSQVNLCLGYRSAPLHVAEFEIECSHGGAQAWIEKTLRAFWDQGLEVALEDEAYGHAAAEAVYDEDEGTINLKRLEAIHPRDCRPYVRGGSLESVRVRTLPDPEGADGGLRLEAAAMRRPAKGLWFVHDSKYDRWNGKTSLIPAWWPWRLKTMPDGGMESLFKWLYKHSISCSIIRHPDQTYVLSEGAEPVHAQALARQMLEQLKSGGIITMDSSRDEHGQLLWSIEQWAKVEGDADGLIRPNEYWDKLIQRGIGIPDEVITHDGNTGGYSRSKVAVVAFYLSAQKRLTAKLQQLDEQIIRPGVRLNFGDVKYLLRAKPLLSGDSSRGEDDGAEVAAPGGGGAEDPLASLLGGAGEEGGSASQGAPVAMSQWTLARQGPRGGNIWVSEQGAEYHGPRPPSTRQEVTRQVGDAVEKAAWTGAKIAGQGVMAAKDAAAGAAQRLGQSAWERLSPQNRDRAARVWARAKAFEHRVMTGFRVTRELAVEAAKERGVSPDAAERVGKILGTVDLALAWTVNMPVASAAAGAVAGPTAALVAGKAASWMPLASLAYVAYSTARDFRATLRAARSLVAKKHGEGQGTTPTPSPVALSQAGASVRRLSPEDVRRHAGELASRVERYGDWYVALILVALGQSAGDVNQAIRLADAAVKEDPHGPDGLPQVTLSQAGLSAEAAFYLALREEVKALRDGIRWDDVRRRASS